jgi:hypothetical protein
MTSDSIEAVGHQQSAASQKTSGHIIKAAQGGTPDDS